MSPTSYQAAPPRNRAAYFKDRRLFRQVTLKQDELFFIRGE